MLERLWTFLAAEGGTFVATLLGVLAAFGLDRLVDTWRDRAHRRRQQGELRDIEGLLADALSYNLSILQDIVQTVEQGDAQGHAKVASFRFAVWEANAARFMALCPDAQEKTDFALFFEELNRIRAMRVLESPRTVGGSPETARVYLTAIEDAIRLAVNRLRVHGTPAQARPASESLEPILQELKRKRASMLPWEKQ